MSESRRKPEIIVFAGPNGSGKSTITGYLRPVDIPYVNADEIQLATGCDTYEAAISAEKRREQFLADKKSFCFETVLSTDRNIKLLQRAKEAGFFIKCYYVLTYNPLINVARVASRVQSGGHDVPADKIVSRYNKALALLPSLLPICDICHIYDNTEDTAYRIFKKRKDEYLYCPQPGLWLKEDIFALTGVDNAVKSALNIRTLPKR